jgi:hypothetical protein
VLAENGLDLHGCKYRRGDVGGFPYRDSVPDLMAWLLSVARFAVLLAALPAVIGGALVGALFATGIASWYRTFALRSGTGRRAGSRPTHVPSAHRTSRLTCLAAAGGMALVTMGIGQAFASHHRWVMATTSTAAGLFVARSGVRMRVTLIELDVHGILIRYARSPPHAIPWIGFVALRPPRWPMGGWRLDGSAGSRSLMPSDLWRNEEVLDAIVERAGLTFDGRAWRRVGDAGHSPSVRYSAFPRTSWIRRS